jgi:dienelactone hydrolase
VFFPTRALVLTVLACLGLVAAARAQEFAPGQIAPQVVTRADVRQSYALYLPASYEPSRAWPVIFIFDSGARGRDAVERLRPAAEKFGYVVAGSNNSRNGPVEPQYQAMLAMINDASQRVSLDPKRVYVAGLSGGARVAFMTALMIRVRGVLACSAGLPGNAELPAKVPFAVFGTTGPTDFNFSEMKRLDYALEDHGATHRLVNTGGGHAWATADVLLQAVEWFELEAMRGGVRPKDETIIGAALAARLQALPATPAPSRWQALQALVRDFRGLVDVSTQEKQEKDLAKAREVTAWLKADRKAADREAGYVEDLLNAESESDVATIKRIAGELRRMLAGPADSEEQQMARRVITDFNGQMRGEIRRLFTEGAYRDAESLLDSMSAFDATDFRTRYDLARARAYLGDRKGTLTALTEAVKAGYTNAAQAAAEPAFAKFKDDAAFQAVLGSIGQPAAPAGARAAGRDNK